MQNKIDYAWSISQDKDFIYTLEAENGQWTHDRKHTIPYFRCMSWGNNLITDSSKCTDGSNKGYWKKCFDFGHCGLSECYYPESVKKTVHTDNWKLGIDECWRLYKNGVTMYGKNKINITKKRFK